jgi:hypothetical protein
MEQTAAGSARRFLQKEPSHFAIIIFSLIAFCYNTEFLWAIPQFAMYNGERCLQCHVNTFGGGLRTSRGANRPGFFGDEPDRTRATGAVGCSFPGKYPEHFF